MVKVTNEPCWLHGSDGCPGGRKLEMDSVWRQDGHLYILARGENDTCSDCGKPFVTNLENCSAWRHPTQQDEKACLVLRAMTTEMPL